MAGCQAASSPAPLAGLRRLTTVLRIAAIVLSVFTVLWTVVALAGLWYMSALQMDWGFVYVFVSMLLALAAALALLLLRRYRDGLSKA